MPACHNRRGDRDGDVGTLPFMQTDGLQAEHHTVGRSRGGLLPHNMKAQTLTVVGRKQQPLGKYMAVRANQQQRHDTLRNGVAQQGDRSLGRNRAQEERIGPAMGHKEKGVAGKGSPHNDAMVTPFISQCPGGISTRE